MTLNEILATRRVDERLGELAMELDPTGQKVVFVADTRIKELDRILRPLFATAKRSAA